MKAAGQRLLIQATADALRAHAPFDAMAPEAVHWLASRAGLAYFPDGAEIVGPGAGAVERLYIVKQGTVQAMPTPELPLEDSVDLAYGPGECFPIAALLARRPAARRYVAKGDVFLYELAEREFRELMESSLPFREFCTDYLSSLLQQSRQSLRAQAAAVLADEERMRAPLRKIVQRAPVSCSGGTPVREALQTMVDRQIGSMVVSDASGVPIGIFTETDVVRRIALDSTDLDTPIERVMTGKPVALEASAAAQEAVFAMARHGIRHVVVIEDGKLAGVVSERDLFSMQQASLHGAWEGIRAAQDETRLAQAAAEVRRLVGQLLAQGVATQQVTLMMSAVSDGIVQAAVRIAATRHGISGRYCWMALGSEGRMEQTLATDQDNALIYEREGDREALLALAADVNAMLDRCGYPLCKGDIMARNPRWCASLERWKSIFADWINNPVPQALLHAAIFFDLRAIAGEAQLVGEVRAQMLARASANRAFLRAMALNALDSRPALGLWGSLRFDDAGEVPGTMDLKKSGARPFVDAARVLALMHRLPATGTAERLQAAGAAGALAVPEAAAACDAFHFIQALRLRHQYFSQPGPGSENRLGPAALNTLDRRILKEALREAAKLQQRLRLDLQL